MDDPGQRLIVVGEIAGSFGVQGWVRIRSHTDPDDGLFGYSPWYLGTDPGPGDSAPALGPRRRRASGPRPSSGGERTCRVLEWRRHQPGFIARLPGVNDREAAAELAGTPICVRRQQLPPAEPGEYYWADLIGLQVVTESGQPLGKVHELLQTGANDVLVVRGERERLVPFLVPDVIKQVDLAGGVLRVDWDPDF
ncbi:MAG: 16S rRNA processing protein RimM [Gammaproteobacteria bacterium]|nr:16S rRNA processing protein RimM [Gammaproteobacteria bacterium]